MTPSESFHLPFDHLIESQRLTISPPPLPSSVRYTDDFTEISHLLRNFDDKKWRVSCNGTWENIAFDRYEEDVNLLAVMKAFALDTLTRFSASAVVRHSIGLKHFSISVIVEMLEIKPEISRQAWDALRTQCSVASAFIALKALLRFASERRLGQWNPGYLPYISSSLPLPSVDKYAAVRTGDVFLSLQEEAALVRWIFECARNAQSLSDRDLTDAALVICNYQFAMRPKQIGVLRRRDCRVLNSSFGGADAVHLTFRMIKQKTSSKMSIPLIRKVKREWSSIFSEIYSRNSQDTGDAYLLGHASASEVATRLKNLLSGILGGQRSAMDLRHSGAMRQVDAGASSEELAEFMGHSSLDSGLVYYDTSATQTERVNEALGISETYKRLVVLARDRFISTEELAKLKGEQQIAGVPHGIPISGIGGCETGQPSCPYNPITACYGCPKFMPVSDKNIHKQVLLDLREVVKFFYEASRGESESPAYLQLKITISEVNAVINELEFENE